MQYMEIVKKSFSNAWNYKFLWLFGFFVAAADNGSGIYQWDDLRKPREYLEDNLYSTGLSDYLPFDIDPMIFAYILLLIFSIGVIFWLISIFSEGALIFGIFKKERNESTSFSQCWNEALNKFFRLFGIMVVTTVIIVAIVLFMVLVIVPSFAVSPALGVLMIIGAFFFFIPILFVIICVNSWAIRYAVLKDINWFDSIGKGWELFIKKFSETVGIAFSSLIAQIVINIGLAFGLLILAIPFVIMGVINIWLGLIPGIFVFITILVLISSYMGVFSSSVWTIGFMKLTDQQEPESL